MKLTKQSMIEFLLMSLGAALVSMGVYFFKFPNHFSTGGVSGGGVSGWTGTDGLPPSIPAHAASRQKHSAKKAAAKCLIQFSLPCFYLITGPMANSCPGPACASSGNART